ncbi:MAG TPA: YfhO family protein, partial [Anaerolineae bacterium]|nr:YfhO family protein [Anaerolineae bacterium]
NYGRESITIAVETDQAGYLVLADAYYPGWQATLDEQPVPIERANYAFRAVYVPAGQHLVRFEFDPWTWKVGLALSGLTGLALGLWLAVVWFKTS